MATKDEINRRWLRTRVVKRKLPVIMTLGLRSDGQAWVNWMLADDPCATPEKVRKEFDKLLKRQGKGETHPLDLYKGRRGFVEEPE